MGLTISSLFSRLFGKKQMRILMGKGRQRSAAAARPPADPRSVAAALRGSRPPPGPPAPSRTRPAGGGGGEAGGRGPRTQGRGFASSRGVGDGTPLCPLPSGLPGSLGSERAAGGEGAVREGGGDGDMSVLPFSPPRSRFLLSCVPPPPPPRSRCRGTAAARDKGRQSPAVCGVGGGRAGLRPLRLPPALPLAAGRSGT